MRKLPLLTVTPHFSVALALALALAAAAVHKKEILTNKVDYFIAWLKGPELQIPKIFSSFSLLLFFCVSKN